MCYFLPSSSGRLAEITFRDLGLSKNDYLWTVPNTFVASSNCALYCGAKVDFVDIDPITNNISIHELKRKLKISKLKNLKKRKKNVN